MRETCSPHQLVARGLDRGGAPPREVARMHLRHLVVAQLHHAEAARLQLRVQLRAVRLLPRAAAAQTAQTAAHTAKARTRRAGGGRLVRHEDVRLLRRRLQPVGELRDVARVDLVVPGSKRSVLQHVEE